MPGVFQVSRWSYALNWGQQGLTAVLTLVLAGWLGPEKFGAVAIAMAVVLLTQVLVDQGLTVALIQHRDLQPRHLDATFWAVLGFCTALIVSIWAIAGPWARANEDPQIAALLRALSPLVLIKGLSMIPMALLRRSLDFRRLALLTNTALAAGALIALALVISGAGVWALVAYHLVAEGLIAMLSWFASDWRPRRRAEWRSLTELWPVASGAFVSALGQFVRTRADVIVMGLFLGPGVVGLFRLAVRISELILTLTMRPVAQVMLPMLARVADSPAAVPELTANGLRLGAMFSVPAFAITAALSPRILGAVGPDWVPGWPALSLLCVAGIANVSSHLVPQILNGLGRAWSVAAWSWSVALASLPAFVLAAWAAEEAPLEVQAGAAGLAACVVALAVALPMAARQFGRVTGDTRALKSLLGPLLRPGVAGFIGAFVALLADSALAEAGPWARLTFAGGSGGAAAFVGLMAIEPTFRSDILGPLCAKLRRP